MAQESIKNFVRTYLDFSFSLFFIKSNKILKEYKTFFDEKIVKNPLTYRQRISVILDEKRNLIVAGAGTGKTTTILAKVLYLIESKKYSEDEILLLAFSKSAKEEMKERLEKKSLGKVKVSTIHALGREIISKVSGSVEVTKLSSDNDRLNSFITEQINSIKQDDPLYADLATFFSELLIPFKPETDFESPEEYLSWKSMNSLITLNKDWVKSYGELKIGNFLYTNGIDHLYEENYKTSDNQRLKDFYRPDFYLNGKKTYIEYFGIDANGRTSPWINNKRYLDGIKWKRKIHKENQTNLIEITYQDLIDDVWKEKLIEGLKVYNISLNPRSSVEIIERVKEINDNKLFTKFSKLISQFLTLFKSKSMDIDELINQNKDNERHYIFVKIFKYVYEKYEANLKETGSIDYMDMLNQSSQAVKNLKYNPQWKYIIVDEFQDTSFAQYELINNMLAVNEKTKLFCVGDDWQSINAFNGSDYHYMTDYKEYFGVANIWSKITGMEQEATLINLDETFRFNNMISHTSGEFIQKNPAQIVKKLKTPEHLLTNNESVVLHWNSGNIESTIRDWLQQNAKDKYFRDKNLLILSRYNFEHKNLSIKFRKFITDEWSHNGEVNYSTCHSSKGTEEDIVLIINLTADFLGFPSNIIDDPVLELVKTVDVNEYLHAEERRLMYVAITRARHQTHILCDLVKPSVFALELEDQKYKTKVFRHSDGLTPCPQCEKGFVINKTKDKNKRDFFQCSRAEVCDYVAAICECGYHLDRYKNDKEVACNKCGKKYGCCNTCKHGVLIKKESKDNKFTPFFACHNFPKCRGRGFKEGITL